MIENGLPDGDPAPDRCYVFNFKSPDKPILMTLATGTGPAFQQEMDDFAIFAEKELPEYFSSNRIKAKQKDLADETQKKIKAVGSPFEEELRDNNLAMIPMQVARTWSPSSFL
jgi:Lon-like ATP-dependent protease